MYTLVPYESSKVKNIESTNILPCKKLNDNSDNLLDQTLENILNYEYTNTVSIKKEPLYLQYIQNPTVEMFKAGLRSPIALNLVKQQTPEIVYVALKKNIFYKHQLNGTGIISVMKIYQDITGTVMPIKNVSCIPNINNPMNSYPWLLDAHQKVIDKMINTIAEHNTFRLSDTMDFTFFCLRNNLTYKQANNLLSTLDRENNNLMFNKLQEECPEFCKFLTYNHGIQIIHCKKDNDYVDHNSEYKLVDNYTKLLDL